MTPDPGAIVASALTDFQGYLTTNAPAILGIAVIAFAIPFVWRWARRLIG